MNNTHVTTLQAEDILAVRSFLATQRRMHTHLDWYSTIDLLESPALEAVVIRGNGQQQPVMAAMGVTVNAGGAGWLRFCALGDHVDDSLTDALWAHLVERLSARGVSVLGVLPFDIWIESHLRSWRFIATNEVVTLRHRKRKMSAFAPPPGLTIRPAEPADIPAIAQVDAAAFAPLWRNSVENLQFANRMAASFTLAEEADRIVGYQLSTQFGRTGHLARLAVLPDLQSRGVGSALVGDMLDFFYQRDIREITVNTQRDNLASQHVYSKLGFAMTRQTLPVWTCEWQ